MTPLWMEKYSPFITGPIAGVVALWLALEFGNPPATGLLATGLLVFAAGTAVMSARLRKALLPLKGSRVMDLAHRTGYINEINSYLSQGMLTALGTVPIAALGFFFGGHPVGGAIWADLAAAALTAGIHMHARNALMIRQLQRRCAEEQDPG